MKNLPPEEVDQIYQDIVKKCPDCGGFGVQIKVGERIRKLENCSCTRRAYLEVKYREAGIPPKYVHFTLRNLTKSFRVENQKALTLLQQFQSSLDERVRGGSGLYIHSGPGLAKSSLACWLLKEIIKKGYSGYFIRASQLVSMGFNKITEPQVAADLAELTSGQVRAVVIDEFHRIYLGKDPDSYASTLINEVIGGFYDNEVCLIVLCNVSLNYLQEKGKFDPTIIDRMRELKDIEFAGASYRGSVEEPLL
jgi:DNA replication protein DnaC